MIKIGVPACFLYQDTERKVFGPKVLSYVENDMVKFICQKGVMPILIPDVEPELQQQYLDEVDGFVFQGGNDVNPLTYATKHLDEEKWPGDKYRDEFEIKILNYAIHSKKPVLGICRGFQLINVAYGGTLHQDIPTMVGNSVKHRDAIEYDHVHHSVRVEEGSLLYEAYGERELEVNSVHHQAVKNLAPNFIVEATSPDDGIIEAIRFHDLKEHFVWGVQWHPEFNHTLGDQIAPANPIIDKFLKEVRARKK